MTIDSPYWMSGEDGGFHWQWCEKHNCPDIPCPLCLAQHDTDVRVVLSEMDRNAMDWQPDLTVRDMLPSGEVGDWLLGQVAY